MPTYAFRNIETGEVKEYTMRISELDKFKSDNPLLERYISSETSNIGFQINDGGSRFKSMNGGLTKCDPRFEECVIDKIKRNVHGNTLVKNHKTSQNKL